MLSPSFAVSLGCERRIITWQDVQDICRGDMEERWLLALHKNCERKVRHFRQSQDVFVLQKSGRKVGGLHTLVSAYITAPLL